MQTKTNTEYYAEFNHGSETRMVFFRTTQTDLDHLKRSAVERLTQMYGTQAAQKYVLHLLYRYGQRNAPLYDRNEIPRPRNEVIRKPTADKTRKPNRQEISIIIRDRVISGDYKPNCRIPSHLDIANELGVSARTVGLAVADLCKQGYLKTSPGVGTYPIPKEE